jgi:hypothetical protein
MNQTLKPGTAQWLAATLFGITAAVALLPLVGCDAIGYVNTVIEAEKDVEFQARYRGLDHHRVAVLVDAPLDVQFDRPMAVPGLCDLISGGISQYCEGARVRPPAQVIAYLANDVYWPMKDPAELAAALGVDRLVLVDLVEYRLNAPGNSYVWDGLIIAEIGVIEADGADPTTPVFRERVSARFPLVGSVSRDKEPEQKIEQGLQIGLSQKAIRLFFDYTRKAGDIDDEKRLERHNN